MIINLQISGMHCAACRASVLDAAASVGAIGDVDLISGTAVFNANDANALKEAINRAGFSAEIASSIKPPPLWREFISPLLALFCALACLWLNFLPAALICALGVSIGAGKFIFRALFRRAFGMDLLISLGIFINFLFSFFGAHEYFFECSFIAFVVSFGKAIENAAKRYAAGLLRPRTKGYARLKSGEIIRAEKIKAKDVLLLLAGEALHTDARANSLASWDLSVVSGESSAVQKAPGELINAGAIALNDAECIAECDYEHSSLAKLANLAQQGSLSGQKDYVWVDKFARYFSALIISLAAITFAMWWAFAQLEQAAFYAASVLLISCPCALGLAVPMSISAGIARCFLRGEIVKNSGIFTKKLGVLLLDKTGTIAKLQADLADISQADAALLCALQRCVEHPISAAVQSAIIKRFGENLKLPQLDSLPVLRGANLEYKGRANDDYIELSCSANDSGFSLFINQNLRAQVKIFSVISPAASALASKYECAIASGDNLEAVQTAAKCAQIKLAFARASAQDKALIARAFRAGFKAVYASVREFALAQPAACAKPAACNFAPAISTPKSLVFTSATNCCDFGVAKRALATSGFVLDGDLIAIDCASSDGQRLLARLKSAHNISKIAATSAVFYIGDGANDLGCIRAAHFTIALAHATAALSAKAAAVVPDISSALGFLRTCEAVRGKIRSNLIISFVYNLIGIAFASGIFALLARYFGDTSSVLAAAARVNLHLNPAICATLMSVSSLVVMINSLLLLRSSSAAPNR